MSSIEVGQSIVSFQKTTPICGNCKFMVREANGGKSPDLICSPGGWFVRFASTCKKHEFKNGGRDVTPKR